MTFSEGDIKTEMRLPFELNWAHFDVVWKSYNYYEWSQFFEFVLQYLIIFHLVENLQSLDICRWHTMHGKSYLFLQL